MMLLESCRYDKGTRKLVKSEALMGRVWDIEDLVKMGSQMTCMYFPSSPRILLFFLFI